MNYNITAFSLRFGNALKKVRGFKQVENSKVWMKTENTGSEILERRILPSGTNVLTKRIGEETRKKVIKFNGTVYTSEFYKNLWIQAQRKIPYEFTSTGYFNIGRRPKGAVNAVEFKTFRDNIEF